MKTKNMIFLEVTMTIIGEMHQQNGYSVLNTIIHKESHSLM